MNGETLTLLECLPSWDGSAVIAQSGVSSALCEVYKRF
jgi:hypothetical protein